MVPQQAGQAGWNLMHISIITAMLHSVGISAHGNGGSLQTKPTALCGADFGCSLWTPYCPSCWLSSLVDAG